MIFKIHVSFSIDKKNVWNPVVDSVLGLCHTFNPKTFQNGSVPIKYHAHNGQIHPAEIHLEFDVRYFFLVCL